MAGSAESGRSMLPQKGKMTTMRIRTTEPTLKTIRDTSACLPRLDACLVGAALGAEGATERQKDAADRRHADGPESDQCIPAGTMASGPCDDSSPDDAAGGFCSMVTITFPDRAT